MAKTVLIQFGSNIFILCDPTRPYAIPIKKADAVRHAKCVLYETGQGETVPTTRSLIITTQRNIMPALCLLIVKESEKFSRPALVWA